MISWSDPGAGESSVRWCGRAGRSQLTEAGGWWSAASDLWTSNSVSRARLHIYVGGGREPGTATNESERKVLWGLTVSSPGPGPGLSASLCWHTFTQLVSDSLTASRPHQAHQAARLPTHQQFVLKLSSSYFSRPLQPASIDPGQTLRWINMKFVI